MMPLTAEDELLVSSLIPGLKVLAPNASLEAIESVIRRTMAGVERFIHDEPAEEAAERASFEADGWVTRRGDGEWDAATWKCWRGWLARANLGRGARR